MDLKSKKFVIYTYFFTWFFWLILGITANYFGYSYGDPLYLFLFIMGGLGPFYVVFIVYNPQKELRMYKRIKRRIFKWNVSIRWYGWLFVIPFLIFLMPWALNSFVFNNSMILFRQNVLIVVPLIFVNIVMGGLEEVGWRGVLLPGLLKKHNKISATIMTSLIWSGWHLPLWFIKGSPQKDLNFIIFIILGLVFSLQLTIIYIKTKSLFLCIILHSIFNSYPGIINIFSDRMYLSTTAMLLFSFLIFIIIYPKKVGLKFKALNNTRF